LTSGIWRFRCRSASVPSTASCLPASRSFSFRPLTLRQNFKMLLNCNR
jgi:hypothetical protein